MADVNTGMAVQFEGKEALQGVTKLNAQMDELIATVQRLGVITAHAMSNTTKEMKETQKEVSKTKKEFNLLGSVMRGIGAIAGAVFVANIFRNVAVWTIRATGEFQSLSNQLLLVEGSMGAVTNRVTGLGFEFLNMGVAIEDGLGLYNRLSLLGVQNAEALSRSVMQLSSTFGLSRDAIQRTSMAISQMFSKGVFVRAEELNQQLQESLPQATRVAAVGFKKLGNQALDTVQEIQQTMQAGKLRVEDFYEALIAGTEDFYNQSAAIVNLQLQFENFLNTIRTSVQMFMTYTGAGQALAIVLNGINTIIQETIKNMSHQGQVVTELRGDTTSFGDSVHNVVLELLDFLSGIESAINFVVGFGKVIFNLIQMLFRLAQAIVIPFAALGMLLADAASGFKNAGAIAKGFGKTMSDLGGAIANDFAQMWQGGVDMAKGSPFTDRLRAMIGDRERTRKIVDEAIKSPIDLSSNEGGISDAETKKKVDKTADRLRAAQQRLVEFSESITELGRQINNEAFEPVSELSKLIQEAQEPWSRLSNRVTDLTTDLQNLGAQGLVDVSDEIARLTEMQQRLTEATNRAAEAAQRQYELNNRERNLGVTEEQISLQRDTEDLMRQVTVVWASEGQQELLKIERDLAQERQDIAMKLARQTLEYDRLIEQGRVEEAVALQAIILMNEDYKRTLEGVNGATIQAAERMRQFVNALSGATQSAISDLIVGLTDLNNFDFNAWANDLVGQITRAIADQWSQQITDWIFEKLFGGKQQRVHTIIAQNLQVANQSGGTTNGGGLLSNIASLFGGGGGASGEGGGGFFSGMLNIGKTLLSSVIGMPMPFAQGGVIGGPTLFGMAGEKGDEGILPLERIGGKLGVNAVTGGGGDTYHVNIQAIDTQTGVQFLQQNAHVIVGALQSQRNLGRRV